jgi:hypothetical protein
MLMPALEKAREAARRATCLANLKHRGLAYHMYANDFVGFLPHSRYSDSGSLNSNNAKRNCGMLEDEMSRQLYTYTGSHLKVWWCPEAWGQPTGRDRDLFQTKWPTKGVEWQRKITSAGGGFIRTIPKNIEDLSKISGSWTFRWLFLDPSYLISPRLRLSWCSGGMAEFPAPTLGHTPGEAIVLAEAYPLPGENYLRGWNRRHDLAWEQLGGGNVLRADGSAEWLKVATVATINPGYCGARINDYPDVPHWQWYPRAHWSASIVADAR